MPAYKLTYFDIRGLAETARQILTYAGVKFEDVRLNDQQWAEMKPSMCWLLFICEKWPNSETPFGQLPVLNIEGVEIAQSFSIYRFLAKRFGKRHL